MIERWYNREHLSKKEIAKRLDKSERTIRREIKRGLTVNLNTYLEKEYYTDKEKRLYKAHLRNIGKGERFTYGEFVIFEPNQVKSATDNVGAFSKEDNNIYHSSITEERITLMPNVPSIASISDILPLAQQPEFDALVASAEFETSCR